MVKQPTKTAKSNDRIEELTKLKDLLDTGVITQEEFDAKKNKSWAYDYDEKRVV